MYGFAENGVAKILAAHVVTAAGSVTASAACPQERSARTFRLTGSGDSGQDFRGAGIHKPGRDTDHGLGVAFLHASQAKFGEPTDDPAAYRGVLVVAAELGDGSGDDRVDSQDSPDLGSRGGISAIAVGEILLGENFIERIPLNHRVLAVLHQFLHEQVGNTFAYVHVGSEDRRYRTLHCTVVEVKYGNTLFRWRLLRKRTGKEA